MARTRNNKKIQKLQEISDKFINYVEYCATTDCWAKLESWSQVSTWSKPAKRAAVAGVISAGLSWQSQRALRNFGESIMRTIAAPIVVPLLAILIIQGGMGIIMALGSQGYHSPYSPPPSRLKEAWNNLCDKGIDLLAEAIVLGGRAYMSPATPFVIGGVAAYVTYRRYSTTSPLPTTNNIATAMANTSLTDTPSSSSQNQCMDNDTFTPFDIAVDDRP